MFKVVCFLLVLLPATEVVLPSFAVAQPSEDLHTNAEVYQHLALECLATLPTALEAVILDAPSSMPFIQSALVVQWQQTNKTVYLADSSQAIPSSIPNLRFTIPSARVSYARLSRRSMQRTVQLTTHKTLTDAAGVVLQDATCERQHIDSLRVAELKRIESDAYPETRGTPPKAGWPRRLLEPLVLTTATAISVYLFFNLRSNSSDTDT